MENFSFLVEKEEKEEMEEIKHQNKLLVHENEFLKNEILALHTKLSNMKNDFFAELDKREELIERFENYQEKVGLYCSFETCCLYCGLPASVI